MNESTVSIHDQPIIVADDQASSTDNKDSIVYLSERSSSVKQLFDMSLNDHESQDVDDPDVFVANNTIDNSEHSRDTLNSTERQSSNMGSIKIGSSNMRSSKIRSSKIRSNGIRPNGIRSSKIRSSINKN
ncbi:hypothetical protein GJ496_002693 [Pomphorhynchus laevis]|nr:hypothetical protein GJ496_002693 [Pomphorhynchus laevis]